ncbi:MAG TPA: serine/threonine protein kinase [Gammaproteobacteria bacterium]|nr:serine/threonine protein kinase [Gammaproteobacteria bacterium]
MRLTHDRTTPATRPYAGLHPEAILDAIAASGHEPDGRLFALNSFENRVYQIGLEGEAPLIAKFYRPGRWSEAAIREEHAFLAELAAADLWVLAPLTDACGETLHRSASGHCFALFQRFGGRPPDPDDREQLISLGRLLARIHAIGGTRRYLARPTLAAHLDLHAAREDVLQGPLLPAGARAAWQSAADRLIATVEELEALLPAPIGVRLHGDCHAGNVLVRDERTWLVDFDDSVSGPPVQDLWMLLGAAGHEAERRQGLLLEGYLEFADFDVGEWRRVEALRARRMLHFMAWVTRRWDDPAFPPAFPWYGQAAHWDREVAALREQAEAVEAASE